MSHARLEAVGGYLEPCSAILGHLEGVLRPFGYVEGYVELCLAILGHCEGNFVISRTLLEPSWAKKGGVEGLRERLGGLLGRSWAPWLKKRGGSIPVAPSEALKRRLGAVLERSWAPRGRSWGRLGPSWAPLGALLGHLGAILRPQRPIGSEKARRPKTVMFLSGY